MKADDYQQQALRTAGDHDMLVYTALGLAGEAGEVADLTKKWLYHGHEYNREKFLEELGDVAWYLATACAAHDLYLSEVMENNLDKLRKRYGDEFSSEKSINRKA